MPEVDHKKASEAYHAKRVKAIVPPNRTFHTPEGEFGPGEECLLHPDEIKSLKSRGFFDAVPPVGKGPQVRNDIGDEDAPRVIQGA